MRLTKTIVKGKKMKKLLVFTMICLGRLGLAHEGHGIPGALPPAPHGGVVQEAGHVGEDKHAHGKEETELFFEVVYKDKELSIYPLALMPDKTNAFVPVGAKTALSKIDLKAELPRAKKVEKLTPKIEDEAIKAAFDSKGVNRFIVHVGAEFEKEMKLAKVQIEKK